MTAQVKKDSIVADQKYREDQFYFGVSYNFLDDKPSGLRQNGFSTGLQLGFIRDMPINEARNWAVGLGLGLATNTYNQNMLIRSVGSDSYNYEFTNQAGSSVRKNKFNTYAIELPLELRWRTSTATEYKFWRVYGGLKMSYVFLNDSKYEGSLGSFKNRNISDIEKLQYGLTLSAGYSTWNFHVYYALNSIFKDTAMIEGDPITMSSLRVGLIFYIL